MTRILNAIDRQNLRAVGPAVEEISNEFSRVVWSTHVSASLPKPYDKDLAEILFAETYVSEIVRDLLHRLIEINAPHSLIELRVSIVLPWDEKAAIKRLKKEGDPCSE